MNWHYIARRAAGRATCIMNRSARLLPEARILNARGDSRRITIGHNSVVGGELFVFAHGGQISIGDWCFIGPGSRIWSGGSINIGNRVLISHNVNIFDNQTHPISPRLRHRQVREIYARGHPKDIDLQDTELRICDDAWVGAGAIVLRGVTVGKASVVAAGSVVTSNVPEYCIVAGNPARIVRELTDLERSGEGELL